MRVVHMTDVHFLAQPGLRGVLGKRALALANLYVAGRVRYFDARERVRRAVADALQWDADLFVMTGDVTAMAQESEFVEAREAFSPLLDRIPSIVIPGNHDTYTRGSVKNARMEQFFGPWMGGGSWDPEAGRWSGGEPLEASGSVPWPVRFQLGDMDIVATNPCRPTLRATGRFAAGAIERAEQWVAEGRQAGRQVLYLLHYPPLARDGSPYKRDGHSLKDIDELLASYRRAAPHLVLHGHKHEAYRVDLALQDGGSMPILNCGSTSAVSPVEDRAAGYYVIDLEGGEIRKVRRRVLLEGADGFTDHSSSFTAA